MDIDIFCKCYHTVLYVVKLLYKLPYKLHNYEKYFVVFYLLILMPSSFLNVVDERDGTRLDNCVSEIERKYIVEDLS